MPFLASRPRNVGVLTVSVVRSWFFVTLRTFGAFFRAAACSDVRTAAKPLKPLE